MSEDSTPHHSRRKCPECGLVNAGVDEQCRRCGALLPDEEPFAHGSHPAEAVTQPRKRNLLTRIVWVLSATLIILIIWYMSLLFTSEKLQPDQYLKVDVAIGLIEQTGFTREGFVLRHATMFRSSDNWWNRWLGHRDAYAATNFPFEIVTLYPEFFKDPVDDRERAAMLLHEAHHLLGDGEEAALRSTWMSKRQLGWTVDKYRQTKVWDATERLTRERFPYLFQCGSDGKTDCY
jgi:predicted nucleic acid-binding Zn ribbon protein